MHKRIWTIWLVLTAAGASCISGGVTNESSGGTGGECKGDYPECCTVPDHMPCKGLPEQDCEARDYCQAVKGRPWNDKAAPEDFIACRSGCTGYGSYQTCAYGPSNPSACYFIGSGAVPDGWTEIFECHDIPPGYCGEP